MYPVNKCLYGKHYNQMIISYEDFWNVAVPSGAILSFNFFIFEHLFNLYNTKCDVWDYVLLSPVNPDPNWVNHFWIDLKAKNCCRLFMRISRYIYSDAANYEGLHGLKVKMSVYHGYSVSPYISILSFPCCILTLYFSFLSKLI